MRKNKFDIGIWHLIKTTKTIMKYLEFENVETYHKYSNGQLMRMFMLTNEFPGFTT